MVRETSIQAFHEEKDREQVARDENVFYQALLEHGPLTANEVWKKFMGYRSQNSVSPISARLKHKGLIREAGKRKCEISGKTCLTWMVNDKRLSEENRILASVGHSISMPTVPGQMRLL